MILIIYILINSGFRWGVTENLKEISHRSHIAILDRTTSLNMNLI